MELRDRSQVRSDVHDHQDAAHADVEHARTHEYIWWQKDPASTEAMAVEGPVQHDPRRVAFHSSAGRLPTGLTPGRRRRPAPLCPAPAGDGPPQFLIGPGPTRALCRLGGSLRHLDASSGSSVLVQRPRVDHQMIFGGSGRNLTGPTCDK